MFFVNTVLAAVLVTPPFPCPYHPMLVLPPDGRDEKIWVLLATAVVGAEPSRRDRTLIAFVPKVFIPIPKFPFVSKVICGVALVAQLISPTTEEYIPDALSVEKL